MQMETDEGYDSAFAEIQDIDTEMHIPSNALMLCDYYLFFFKLQHNKADTIRYFFYLYHKISMKHLASGLASRYYDGKQAKVIPFLTLRFSLNNLPPPHAMSSIDHLCSQSFHRVEKSARKIMKLTAK